MLFAHGSRDPEWSAPFRKIKEALEKKGLLVELAYLEIMQPSLGEALQALVARHADSIRVVPVFLGYGGHLRKDLPALVAAADAQVQVTIDPPVGEAPQVIEAIAALIGRGR